MQRRDGEMGWEQRLGQRSLSGQGAPGCAKPHRQPGTPKTCQSGCRTEGENKGSETGFAIITKQ